MTSNERRYSVLFDLTTDTFHVADSLTGDVSEETFTTESDAQTVADEWESADGMWSEEQARRDAEREQFGDK